MHNSIYEVSRSPVPVGQRARAGNMPDWFFERVCDYAENPTPRQREEALGVLFKTLGRFCSKEGEKFSLSPKIKEEFFQTRYECFRAAAEALTQTNYQIFGWPWMACGTAMRTNGAFTSTPRRQILW